MRQSSEDGESADERLAALLARWPTADALAEALDAVGRASPSRRRRLQAELLQRTLSQVADLAHCCGWAGKTVLTGGQTLIDQGGALVRAEPRHFRTTVRPLAATLLAPLEMFRIGPRTIVELGAGDGETAIFLARRFPSARVIATLGSSDDLDALDANLALQQPPLENLEVALPDNAAGSLERLRQDFAIRRIDLLKSDAGAVSAASIRAMAGRIVAACISFRASDSSERRDALLAAFEAAGLMLLEKRSRPVADGPAWLAARLAKRPATTAWFVERRRVPQASGFWPRILQTTGALLAEPRRRRILAYRLLDRLVRLNGADNRRFEFERLYAENEDPWLYLTNDYEVRKYRRTLETAIAWRRGAASALEIGCSIGVYTRMLARAFGEVTAVDVAREALKLARRRVGPVGRVSYVRSDIRGLDLGRTFDLIFCAEMLYYLPGEAETGPVLGVLKRHLGPDGILMTVMPGSRDSEDLNPTTFWRARLLEGGFRAVFEEDVPDATRPYRIQIYERAD